MEKEYHVMINLETRHVCPTFQEAWIKMMEEVEKEIEKGLAVQILETTYFIVFKYRNNIEFSLPFYHAKDFAHRIGILKEVEGSVVMNDEYCAEEVEPYIADAFSRCAVLGANDIDEIASLVENFKALDIGEE